MHQVKLELQQFLNLLFIKNKKMVGETITRRFWVIVLYAIIICSIYLSKQNFVMISVFKCQFYDDVDVNKEVDEIF